MSKNVLMAWFVLYQIFHLFRMIPKKLPRPKGTSKTAIRNQLLYDTDYQRYEEEKRKEAERAARNHATRKRFWETGTEAAKAHRAEFRQRRRFC